MWHSCVAQRNGYITCYNNKEHAPRDIEYDVYVQQLSENFDSVKLYVGNLSFFLASSLFELWRSTRFRSFVWYITGKQ